MSILFTIIIVILAVIFIFFALFIFGSIFGTAFFIGFAFKKSAEKKTPDFLKTEKLEMEQKVGILKNDIEDWNKFSINDITNNLNYSYRKSITCKLTGHILSQNNIPIIAFQRIQRGIDLNCRILAGSTAFKYFYEINNDEIIIEYNNQYLGKIKQLTDILDSSNTAIGTLNRNNSTNKYTVTFVESQKSFEINKSYDNKRFVKNVFYKKPNSSHSYETSMMNYKEPYQEYSLISNNQELNSEELKWIIGIAIYESIFYSFDFNFVS